MADLFVDTPFNQSSPCSKSEVADFSSSDHEFAFIPRALRVIGAGTLRYRLAGDDEDRAITFTAGWRDLPDRVSVVRSTTSSTLSVWGLS